MNKHVYFWIGVFTAALLAVPLALMVWGTVTETAMQVATFVFGAIAMLVVVLVTILVFRDAILRRILKKSEVTLDELTERAVSFASSLAQRDADRIESEAKEIAKSISGWWAWSNLYRWVIGTALALLLAFGAFTGTVLLFEQTKKVSEQTTQFAMQNDLMSLTLVSELRSQLVHTVDEINVVNAIEDALLDSFFEVSGVADARIWFEHGCSLKMNEELALLRPPSEATLQAIENMAERDLLGAHIRSALKNLLLDRNDAVVFGAAWILAKLDELPDDSELVFNKLAVIALPVDFPVRVEFYRSFLMGVTCEACEIEMHDSFELLNNYSGDVFIIDSISLSDVSEALNKALTSHVTPDESADIEIAQTRGVVVIEGSTEFSIGFDGILSCGDIEANYRGNPFVIFEQQDNLPSSVAQEFEAVPPDQVLEE